MLAHCAQGGQRGHAPIAPLPMPDLIRRVRDTLQSRLGGPTEMDFIGAPGSVQVRNLTAGYGRATVFTGLNLHVNPGEFLYLIGPSGSGKSTLIKILYGTVRA